MKIFKRAILYLITILIMSGYSSVYAVNYCADGEHYFSSQRLSSTRIDDEYHYYEDVCQRCGFIEYRGIYHFYKQLTDYPFSPYQDVKFDDTYHYIVEECIDCGYHRTLTEKHIPREPEDELDIDYYYLNKTYHAQKIRCEECNYYFLTQNKSKHECDYSIDGNWIVVQKATPFKDGKVDLFCEGCGEYYTITTKWSMDYDFSVCYDPTQSKVSASDTKITIFLPSKLKGGEVRVKIGSKTYSKMITTTSKKITVPIDPAIYKKKIQTKVYYNGKLVGVSTKDKVLYAKGIEIGMTKTQVQKVLGKPNSTGATEGGWEYWYYGNGAYVKFKDGAVYSWYKLNF